MFSKRLEGRDEPIISPEIPIIDAHHHLFDLPVDRYLIDDYLADANAGHDIRASVYIEIKAFARNTGPEILKPLGEIEFANGVGAMGASGVYGKCRVAAAIVGYVDFREGDAVGGVLDKAMAAAPDRFRGIRQVAIEHPSDAPYRYIVNRPPRGLLEHPRFRDGFTHLSRRGLAFDVAVFHNQIPQVTALAAAFPETAVILNHVGTPMAMERDPNGRTQVFREWRDALKRLAQQPNAVCKISGFGLPFLGFDFIGRTDVVSYMELSEAWKPYIETTIEAFGPARCMMASNFPQDGRACGFVPLWNALKHSVASYSTSEKADLFFNTAARVYRLSVDS